MQTIQTIILTCQMQKTTSNLPLIWTDSQLSHDLLLSFELNAAE